MLKEPEEFKSDPLVSKDFENAVGDEIPDPAAYTEWFASASEAARVEAVGARRYGMMADRLEGYGLRPAWNDFLAPDGKLVPVKVLKKETPEKHVERREAVDKMLLDRQMDFIKVAGHGFLSEKPPVLKPESAKIKPRKTGRLRKRERISA